MDGIPGLAYRLIMPWLTFPTVVGSNAIQLVGNAGYRVVATASARNFDYLRSLGAAATIDRNR